ncbi:MAG TPA: CaiB/BaiF CoA-transferase family protein [Thermodesulfobacteriota bacterium]|nr:CaiB/BaiF CoA-transferase family protein [Thermodesulfobacteriota bacterium]
MGPLTGFRVLELAGIGPGPLCCMLLSDMGAEVVRVDRVQPSGLGIAVPARFDVLGRGRRSIAIDLQKKQGAETLLRMAGKADALVEGFRPGVMERLGIGPDACLARNPKLVYGRMTGWGQEGPLAQAAGHDINYISLVGALHSIGRAGGPPVPPLNLVGDYGGGGVYLAFGVVCALLEASKSGRGQVVDAAMVDGAASLMTMFYALKAMGVWNEKRGENLLDTGAHFYDVYETSDGKYISVGAIEGKFYGELLRLTGIEGGKLAGQLDRAKWPEMKQTLASVFKKKTRDEWCAILEGTDACFAPVLSMEEAPRHPHNQARGVFISPGGVTQPGPAPRFSRTKPQVQGPPPNPGQHTDEVLANWGFKPEEVESLRKRGVVK